MKLYPYQETGAEFLASRHRAGLFDEMGVGKTVQAIAAAERVGLPMVVVSPPPVLFNWPREIEKWSSRSPGVIRAGHLTSESEDAVVSSTVLTRREVQDELKRRTGGVLVVDEAHMFKNPDAKRTEALYGIAPEFRYVWILTGTPIPNHFGELWTHLRALFPEDISKSGRVMTYSEFVREFCHYRIDRYSGKPVPTKVKDPDRARKLMRKSFLRRKVEDVIPELPSIRYEICHVSSERLPDEFRDAEQELETTDVDDVLSHVSATTELTTFRRLSGLAKVHPSVDLLSSELESGSLEKVLIGAHHTEVIDRLRKGLAKYGAKSITGSTPAADRQRIVDEFQTDKSTKVLIGQLQALGVGATLTASHEVVFVEMSFVPGDNSQFAKRCHRIGQKNFVRVRCLALAGTSDAVVTDVLRRKTENIKQIL